MSFVTTRLGATFMCARFTFVGQACLHRCACARAAILKRLRVPIKNRCPRVSKHFYAAVWRTSLDEIALNQSLQTTAREAISSGRKDTWSIMEKNNIFTKHLLIW